MAASNYSISNPFQSFWKKLVAKRGLISGIIIVSALLAFETFNFMSTYYALEDLLGNLVLLNISWALILSIAFCGIDFAGIARLFSPRGAGNEQKEVWYLFAAWLLAATMNAMLTWWGVSLAILNAQSAGSAVIGRQTLVKVVPIFVAVLVWLIRVLIIGSFSIAGEELFAHEGRTTNSQTYRPDQIPSAQPPTYRPLSGGNNNRLPKPVPAASMSNGPSFKPAPKTSSFKDTGMEPVRPDPTYHSVNAPANPSAAAAPGRDASQANPINAASSRSGPFTPRNS
jgi:hypothetical protein